MHKMRTETGIERLDNYIGRLQADVSPGAFSAWGSYDETARGAATELAALQMAAHLGSMRPGANSVDAGFVSRLRARVLAESTLGTDLAG